MGKNENGPKIMKIEIAGYRCKTNFKNTVFPNKTPIMLLTNLLGKKPQLNCILNFPIFRNAVNFLHILILTYSDK
jgi:hypothetical protein